MKLINTTLLSLMVATSANAEGWKGQGEAGLIKTSGNTESENINAGLKFEKQGENWAHEIGLGIIKTSADSVDSANSLNASYIIKRNLTERSYVFGSIGYLDDDFDGFTEQSSLAVGYGYHVFKSDEKNLEVGIGLGYRDTSELLTLEDGTEVEGKDLSSETLVGLLNYDNQLTANTTLFDAFRVEVGSENTFVQNELGLIVAMNEAFSLKASLLARHNTDPAPGSDETDTITAFNLIYNFGK